MSPEVPSGWWKRRYLPASRRVEYHFLRSGIGLNEIAACGEFIGWKPPKCEPAPWTKARGPAVAKYACAACKAALAQAIVAWRGRGA